MSEKKKFPSNHRFHKHARWGLHLVLDKYPHVYDRTSDGVVFRKHEERKTLHINTEPQPWQKHEDKLQRRAMTHLSPLARREARERRKALERAAP